MGEYADWTNDGMQEAYPDWMPVGDPYRAATRARNRRNVICDRCAMRNLTWRETKAGWRLYEDADTMHQCGGPQPLSDDDFDVIEPE